MRLTRAQTPAGIAREAYADFAAGEHRCWMQGRGKRTLLWCPDGIPDGWHVRIEDGVPILARTTTEARAEVLSLAEIEKRFGRRDT